MPAAIPIAAAVAAAAAPAIAGAAGAGRNTTKPLRFDETSSYDPNRFEYGGHAGGANEAASRYRGLGTHAQTRDAAQANYAQADQYAGLGLGARGQQQQIADMMQARAMGLTPSIAQMQGDRQMQQAIAAQGAMAASARGPAGLALAQQQAANNIANAQGQISGQVQVNAANERMQAEQAAMQGLGGMRGADINAQQQAAAQQQFNAGLQMQQRQLNDSMQLGMTQQEAQVRQNQLQAGILQQQMLSGSQQSQQQLRQKQQQANADNEFNLLKMGTGGAMSALSSYGGGGGGGGK